MYDLAIVGAGPAGITAAIYAARKKIKTLVVAGDVGGQAALSSDVENYTGYQFITGSELAEKFKQHLKQFDIELKAGEEVMEVAKTGGFFTVKTSGGAYEARAVIVASGAKPRALNVPGEKEFRNRGVTYCATCDAPVFAGKDVAVVGGGNSAMDAALQLSKTANKTYFINANPELRGDEIMKEKVLAAKNVEVLNNAKIREITGEKTVTGLSVAVGGAEKTLSVQGVFIEIGWVPNSGVAPGTEKNGRGEIIVGPGCETSVSGLFAAGDVTSVPQKQIIVAAGEGAKAALSAFKYLSTTK